MAWPLVAAGAAYLGSQVLGGMGRDAANQAAQNQIYQGMQNNTNVSDQMRGDVTGAYQPYMQAGQQSLNDLAKFRFRQPSGYNAGRFGGVNMEEDPGVAYRMEQSNNALDQSAISRGNIFSGAHAKALQANAQDLTSQEFNNAYNRQYGQWQDAENARRDQYNRDVGYNMNLDQYRLGQLENLAGQGLQAGSGFANNMTNIGTNQLTNDLRLRGVLADRQAENASNWYDVGGNLLGKAASYYMGR